MRELVTYVQYGISAPATETKVGYPILRMNNLQNDGWELSDLKYIELTENEIETYQLRNGDILFNRTNSKELVGKCEVFKEKGDWVFASYLVRVRIDESIALPDFVSIFLNTSSGRVQIDRVSRQIIGMANINAEEIRDLVVPIAPLNQQHALVEEIQTARKTRKQLLKKADALLDSIDDYVLAELGIKMPTVEEKKCFVVRWGAVNDRLDPHFYYPRFEKLLAVLRQGPHEILGNITERCHQKWKPEEHPEKTFRYIEINAVSRDTGEVSFSELPTKEAPNRAQMMVQKDDIIVSLTRPHHGSIALIDDELDGCIVSTGFAVLRKIKDPTISRPYLYSVLRSQLCLQQMLQRSSGGNYPAITTDQLMQILIPIPSPNRQEEIVKELSCRNAKVLRLREEAAKEWEAAKTQFEEQLLSGEVS